MRTQATSTRPAVVLIASKQEWTSRSLESVLASRGYVVVKAYTARGALERAKRDPLHALIIDVELADGAGPDLCRQLRAQGVVPPSTPILLALATPPSRRDRLTALQVGAWACLGPPLDAAEVLAILDVFVAAKLDADRARSEGLVDEATGLYNVRGLTRRSRELAAHAVRAHGSLACVLLAPDLNLEGALEPEGDGPRAALQRIARALQSAGRASDAIGRMGPDAFAIVALSTDAAQARRLAQRLASTILAESDATADPAPLFRLHAGYHAVPDLHAAAIDAVDVMLRATAALRKARTEPARGWLRDFNDDGVPSRS
jgi:diguanylate cyclase (GGDEF)-like protein